MVEYNITFTNRNKFCTIITNSKPSVISDNNFRFYLYQLATLIWDKPLILSYETRLYLRVKIIHFPIFHLFCLSLYMVFLSNISYYHDNIIFTRLPLRVANSLQPYEHFALVVEPCLFLSLGC